MCVADMGELNLLINAALLDLLIAVFRLLNQLNILSQKIVDCSAIKIA
jgi:hypothetical protein